MIPESSRLGEEIENERRLFRRSAVASKSPCILIVSSFCALLLIVDVRFHQDSDTSTSQPEPVLAFELESNQNASRSYDISFAKHLLNRQALLHSDNEQLAQALSSHKEAISKELKGISNLEIHGHLLSTSVNPADGQSVAGCMNIPNLSPEKLATAGASLFSLNNYKSEASADCHGVEVEYENLGVACKQSTEELFLMLYNQGIVSMVLGATREEAFEMLEHSRALAWTLHQCEPTLNPEGQISLPTTYALLYRAASVHLLERLKKSGRVPLMKLTATTIAALKALPEFVKLGERAAATPLKNSLSYESCLPKPDAVSLALSTVTESSESSTTRNSDITCEATDDGAEYFLHKWSKADGATGRLQNCCAVECELLMKTTRGNAGIDACCRACNKASCGGAGDDDAKEVAELSTITRPGSESMDVEIVSIVL